MTAAAAGSMAAVGRRGNGCASAKLRIWAFGGVLLRGETGKRRAIRTHGRGPCNGLKRAHASILCHKRPHGSTATVYRCGVSIRAYARRQA